MLRIDLSFSRFVLLLHLSSSCHAMPCMPCGCPPQSVHEGKSNQTATRPESAGALATMSSHPAFSTLPPLGVAMMLHEVPGRMHLATEKDVCCWLCSYVSLVAAKSSVGGHLHGRVVLRVVFAYCPMTATAGGGPQSADQDQPS